jgi:alpha-L-fucosidase
MRVGAEAIFESRPWHIYGEGPTRVGGGMHGESGGVTWTARDIRFTTRAGVLYALAMEWPEDGRVVIEALGRRATGGKTVDRVELLGGTEPATFVQSDDALTITLPTSRPVEFAPGFRVHGNGLV